MGLDGSPGPGVRAPRIGYLAVDAVVNPVARVARAVGERHPPDAMPLPPLPLALVLLAVGVHERALAVHLPLLDLPGIHESLALGGLLGRLHRRVRRPAHPLRAIHLSPIDL